MTVPLVAAFSASCSRKATLAPRPATSAGSSAARVTLAGTAGAATAPPSPAVLTASVATIVAAAMAAQRDFLVHDLDDIDGLVSLAGTVR